MITDRELLEGAAKAEGRILKYMTQHIEGREPETFIACWNPLTDDGDAFRLAVKLNITVSNSEAQKHACASVLNVQGICLNQHKGDPYAATRRSIVRAAYEIWKEKP